ncbi:MAG TPA: response regulator [Methanoregulaceae archaeon]|nr:response regulator [Methanoregulaceae archaeon]HQJ87905.1 response regulator [Methanoregulaceae archaeon]
MERRVVPGGTVDSPPITILYVDDDPDLLSIGRRFLERLGSYRVESVQSPLDALDRLRQTPVDLVLSDYQMPDMDGITFLKTVRSTYGDLPFILFTGRGREEVVIEALNSGADFYLQKGGDPRSQFVQLDYTIRQAVTRRRILRQARFFDRFNTLFSCISAAARTILNRDLFLQECCRSAVSTGLIQRAWIGRMEGDPVEIEILACATDGSGDDRRSPSSLLEDAVVLEACRAAWATRTLQTCLSSSLPTRVFPLSFNGRCAGVFVVSETYPGMEADEEYSLLGRVAQEISSAIERFERVSDLDRMKETLSDLYVRFELLADHTPLAFLTLDPSGRIIETNRASLDLFGRTREEMVDRPFEQLVIPECRAQLERLFPGAAPARGREWPVRLSLTRDDHLPLDVEVTSRASLGPDGRLLGVHCLLRPLSPADNRVFAFQNDPESSSFRCGSRRMGNGDRARAP